MQANVTIDQILLKRGNTAQISSYVGPVGELVMNTQANLVYLQDGITPGGHLVGGGAGSGNVTSNFGNITVANTSITVTGNTSLNILANTYGWSFGANGTLTLPYGAVFHDTINSGLALGQSAGQISGQFPGSLYDVAYDGVGQYVAVGNDITNNVLILTSPDSTTWTQTQAGVYPDAALYNIVWTGHQFIAVGGTITTTESIVLTSPDGVVWTRQASGSLPGTLYGIDISTGGFSPVYTAVGVDAGGATLILTSTNGIVWLQQASGQFPLFAHGGGGNYAQQVIVGMDASANALILTSTAGGPWTQRAAGLYSGLLYSAAQNPTTGHFVTVGADYSGLGNKALILTSTNGTAWTQVAQNTYTGRLQSVTWSGTEFVAVGYTTVNGNQDLILTSADGATWTPKAIGLGFYSLSNVVWVGNQYIAVGYDSSNTTVILTSPDSQTWTPRAQTGQGIGSVAIGSNSGYALQGNAATAIGFHAGSLQQGKGATAIGYAAGYEKQGENAVAIGNNAGLTNQPAGSIVINASGVELDGSAAGLFVDPVRNNDASITNTVYYNNSTKELTYSANSAVSINSLKTIVAASLDFADFQSRISGL
jgi:hypothetical protein